MKYAKKRNQTPLIVALSVTAVLLLIAIVALLLLDSGEPGGNVPTDHTGDTGIVQTQPDVTDEPDVTDVPDDTTGQAETTEPAQTTAPTDATGPDSEETKPTDAPEIPTSPAAPEVLAIDTPYATLYFPGEWKDNLSMKITEGDIYRVTFVAKLASGRNQDLFTVSFGGTADTAIGSVKTPSGSYVNVQLELADFAPDGSWTEEDRTVVESMRDAVNHVLQNLPLEEAVTEQPTTPAVENDHVVIETDYMKLYYPAKWKDTLKTVEEGNAVHFYCALPGSGDIHLFCVYFGGDRGTVIATTQDAAGNTVEVRIEVYEIDPDPSWTKEQKNTVYGMQEDLNVLMEASFR